MIYWVFLYIRLVGKKTACHYPVMILLVLWVAARGDGAQLSKAHAFGCTMGHPTDVHAVDLLDLLHVEKRLMMSCDVSIEMK